MKIQEFYDPQTYTLTFVAYDPTSRDAVVIDPVLDYDPASSQTSLRSVDAVSDFVRREGLTLCYVLETHANAGWLPPTRANGRRYLSVPINLFRPTDDVGEG